MKIQIFKPKYRVEECLNEIKECLELGWTGMGFKTQEIEENWKDFTKLPNAHFLSSATAGLHLSLEVLKQEYDWSAEDEVITTPLTFVSTGHSIIHAKLKPRFIDIDEYLCLDPDLIEKNITTKTRAVMFVGLGGNVGQLSRVIDICKKNNLKLILDAAHMAGTQFLTNHVGKDVDVSVFSFQAVKNLPTADSGMICFNDKKLDMKARKLSWLGISKDTFSRSTNEGNYKWKYDVESIGYKYHGNSIMASLALVGLKYLDQDNSYRRKLCDLYEEKLKNISSIKIVPTSPDCISSKHLFQIRVANRDEVLEYLYSKDIFPGVHYIDNTQYGVYGISENICPNARKASNEIISLPLHLELVDDDVNRIVDCLKKAAGEQL